MTKLKVLSVTLLLLLHHIDALRGASGEQASRLASGLHCVLRDAPSSSPSVISASRINDNYCDCIDGSDEPGTSACPNGTFYCENRSARPQTIPSSRVDDGVCDCCDGSDESLHTCPDTCETFARQEELVARRAAASIMKGVASRKQYAAEAMKNMKDDDNQLAKLQRELQDVEKRIAQSKRVVSSLEKWKRLHEQSAKQVTADAGKQDGSSAATGSDHRSDFNDDDGDVDLDEFDDEDGDIYEDDDIDEGEENDDDYDASASEANEADQESTHESAENNEEEDTVAETKTTTDIIDTESDVRETDDGDNTASNSDALDTVAPSAEVDEETVDVDVICAQIANANPNALVQQFAYIKALIMSKLVRALPQLSFLSKETVPDDIGECVNRADGSKRDLESKKREIESQIRKIEERKAINYGPDHALRKLHGRCIRKKVTQYEFELCPFDIVKQYENGASIATLGRFSGWDDNAAESRMIYSNGDHCWNGPSRSISVDLSCGETEEIISVDEPNRCTYTMKLKTPGVCEKKAAEAILARLDQHENSSKDEL